ncbi:MAG: hypothetical protein WCW56_02115 [Candidatus Paceibacterota bacterium]|jgi:hypothetical protein
MDETTKCTVCGNEPCTCPVAETAPVAEEVVDMVEETPADEAVA